MLPAPAREAERQNPGQLASDSCRTAKTVCSFSSDCSIKSNTPSDTVSACCSIVVGWVAKGVADSGIREKSSFSSAAFHPAASLRVSDVAKLRSCENTDSQGQLRCLRRSRTVLIGSQLQICCGEIVATIRSKLAETQPQPAALPQRRFCSCTHAYHMPWPMCKGNSCSFGSETSFRLSSNSAKWRTWKPTSALEYSGVAGLKERMLV